ncbi:DUF2145 domain-containing protein [Candidatus Halocynthiibacter alkanivorans]|uniref:DUF2145 domain-containing protein n=1 Tax=Candidatus Halocynthiibacter alkanivorans TaxID=2267619 RepID=UPI000DF177EC|nr:DUF2145 domain-containing protein [Candidatus Halocynthiibacter alkanivorans]
MARLILLILFALVIAVPPVAWAGSSEASKPILPAAEVATFSNRVQQDLAARGVLVAIVARIGRNPARLPEGVRYTHVGFWVYSKITSADGSTGRGYRVYNLYQQADNKTRSNLIQDSPADFFAGAHSLDAGVIIPDARLQKQLLQVIASPTYSSLHNPNYSVLANPNTSQFQNCTEHMLDVLMASLYGTNNVPQIKANVAAHFQPQAIPLNGLQRFLAPAASKALTTEDHGSRVMTATFGAISRFMRANDLASQVYRLTPDRADLL